MSGCPVDRLLSKQRARVSRATQRADPSGLSEGV
jgi:hypothetical protein